MKRCILTLPGFVLAFVLAAFCVAGDPASSQTLYAMGYGLDGASILYTLDPATGDATAVGPVGFDECSGMDFNAAGALFAACRRSDDTSILVRVNATSGVSTEIGPTGVSREIDDISFRADGTLFAFDYSNKLHRLDTLTGAATLVGIAHNRGTSGNALSFVPAGTLYSVQLNLVVGATDLYLSTLDPATGAETSVVLIGSTTNDLFNAMDAHPETGVLFGVVNHGFDTSPGPRSLFALDPVKHTGKLIGPTDDTLHAIAWGPTRGSTPPAIVEVPALNTLGLLVLGTMLALAASIALRRSAVRG